MAADADAGGGDTDLAARFAEAAADTRSAAGAARFLKFCRTTRCTGGARVVAAVGADCRKRHGSALGDEYWLVLEQTAVAALSIGDTDEAAACVKELAARFGVGSSRVARLTGMLAEGSGRTASAAAAYERGLEANATNAAVLKR